MHVAGDSTELRPAGRLREPLVDPGSALGRDPPDELLQISARPVELGSQRFRDPVDIDSLGAGRVELHLQHRDALVKARHRLPDLVARRIERDLCECVVEAVDALAELSSELREALLDRVDALVGHDPLQTGRKLAREARGVRHVLLGALDAPEHLVDPPPEILQRGVSLGEAVGDLLEMRMLSVRVTRLDALLQRGERGVEPGEALIEMVGAIRLESVSKRLDVTVERLT